MRIQKNLWIQEFIENPDSVNMIKEMFNLVLEAYESDYRFTFDSLCEAIMLCDEEIDRQKKDAFDTEMIIGMLIDYIPEKYKDEFKVEAKNIL